MKTLASARLPRCAAGRRAAAGDPVETIVFETGPCFGACPVYRVTVNSDGSGTFEGRRFTAVDRHARLPVTPAQYRAFARQLAPLRPAARHGPLFRRGLPHRWRPTCRRPR